MPAEALPELVLAGQAACPNESGHAYKKFFMGKEVLPVHYRTGSPCCRYLRVLSSKR